MLFLLGVSMKYDKEKVRKEYIELIKSYGQSIIDEAESIYGDFEYPCGLKISFEVDIQKAPIINIEKQIRPKRELDKYLKVGD